MLNAMKHPFNIFVILNASEISVRYSLSRFLATLRNVKGILSC